MNSNVNVNGKIFLATCRDIRCALEELLALTYMIEPILTVGMHRVVGLFVSKVSEAMRSSGHSTSAQNRSFSVIARNSVSSICMSPWVCRRKTIFCCFAVPASPASPGSVGPEHALKMHGQQLLLTVMRINVEAVRTVLKQVIVDGVERGKIVVYSRHSAD